MGFEDKLQSSFFGGSSEKSFIDKVLAKDDVNAIRELIKKPRLSREDLLEILYLISGTESKILNYGEWDRYVILKFFVWIREFIKIAELLYDYEDELNRKGNNCKICLKTIKSEDKHIDKCKCETPTPTLVISLRTRKLLDNNILLIQHNAKFLIDLYLNIARTSMSIGASAFLELVRNKYEVYYPNQQDLVPQQQQRTGFLGGVFKK